MPPPLALKAGDFLIPFERIDHINIASIEQEEIDIVTLDGKSYRASGFDAIEGVMAIRPSAMEGRRLKWRKGAWTFHNLVGHPGTQLLAWLGFKKAAIRFHDYTVPYPRSVKIIDK